MLEQLTRAVAVLFNDDPSAPSVTVAWLEDKQKFYVSVIRYTEPFGQGRVVVHKLQSDSLDNGLREMLQIFSIVEANNG